MSTQDQPAVVYERIGRAALEWWRCKIAVQEASNARARKGSDTNRTALHQAQLRYESAANAFFDLLEARHPVPKNARHSDDWGI